MSLFIEGPLDLRRFVRHLLNVTQTKAKRRGQATKHFAEAFRSSIYFRNEEIHLGLILLMFQGSIYNPASLKVPVALTSGVEVVRVDACGNCRSSTASNSWL